MSRNKTHRIVRLVWMAMLLCSVTPDVLGIALFQEKNKVYQLTSLSDKIDLNDHLYIAEDENGVFQMEDVRAGRYEMSFRSNESISRPLKLDATYWARVMIKSHLDYPSEWLLTIGSASYAIVYVEHENGKHEIKRSGYYLPASLKDEPVGKAEKVKLTISPKETIRILFKINEITKSGPEYDVNLVSKESWAEQIGQRNISQSLFHGAMAIMILFNLAYLFMTRDSSYLFYSLYMICASIYFLSFHNLARELFLVEYPYFHAHVWLIALVCFGFYFQFIRTFLNTRAVLKKWDPYLKALVIIDFLIFFLNLTYYLIASDFPITVWVQNITILCSLAFMIVIVIKAIKLKNIPAKIFIVGNVSLAVFAFVGVYSYVFLGSSKGLDYLQVGLIIEGLIFSLGIGYRYRLRVQTKSTHQTKVIDELKQKDKLSQEINSQLDVKLIENNSRLRLQFKKMQIVNDQLTKSNEEMREISYITSHNLKSPVRALHSLATWLLRDYGTMLDKEGNEKLNLMVSKVNRLDSLLTNILEFLNIGQENESNSKVDTNDLLYSLIGNMEVPSNFKIKIADSLPVLIGKKGGLTQIFQNILIYAIHLNNDTEREINITSTENKEGLIFRIHDDGLDTGDHEKKFNLFHVLNSTNEISSSSVGLSVAKKWIEKFGGKIWTESENGTTFLFSLSRDRMIDEVEVIESKI